MPRYVLSSQISFRTLADVAILVDHRDGEARIMSLNVEAGELLERVAAGEETFDDDDREFIDQLVDLGLAAPAGSAPAAAVDLGPAASADSGAATAAAPADSAAANEEDPEPARQPASPTTADERDLLEELNQHAAELLVPLHCQLELTYRCQLGCDYCYLGDQRASAQAELTTDQVRQLLDELAELGCLFVLLTGGEPLVRPDLLEIFSHARQRRFAVSLLTSGWGLQPELAAKLAAGGLDSAQISLHGATASTHDAFTGKEGSFAAALTALRRFRDLGVRTLAAVTITRRNLDELAALRRLIEDEGVDPNVSFYVQPLRDGSSDPQRLSLDAEGIRRAYEVLPPPGTPRLAGRALDELPCEAGASTIAVDPYGTVYPCHSLRRAAGDWPKQSLQAIWRTSPLLEQLRSLHIAELNDCPSCELRQSCNRCAGFAAGEGFELAGHCPFDCLQAGVVALMRSGGHTPEAS